MTRRPITDIIRTAWRDVAIARVNAFDTACWTLANAYLCGEIDKAAAVDELQAIAAVHSLAETYGADFIADLMADAFRVPRIRLVFHQVRAAA